MTNDAKRLVQWLRDNPGEHRHPRVGARLGWAAERYCNAFVEAHAAGLVRQRGPGCGTENALARWRPAGNITETFIGVTNAPNAGVFISAPN